VGFANVQRIDAMAYLTNISVVPESSGEDVGTSHLEKAEEDAAVPFNPQQHRWSAHDA
jgi:hypothetical protein